MEKKMEHDMETEITPGAILLIRTILHDPEYRIPCKLMQGLGFR